MLLNELAPAHAANPILSAIACAIAPFWKFKGAFVDPKRTRNGMTTVQFRQNTDLPAAEQGYNTLDYKQLDDKMQNALHSAGVEYKQAGFEEIPRNFNAQPIVAYTIVY